MALHPAHLGSRESGKHAVTRAGHDGFATDVAIETVAFVCTASVVPENARAQRSIAAVHEGGAVHLTAEADAGNAVGCIGMAKANGGCYGGARGLVGSAHPVVGVLLTPLRARGRERILHCCVGNGRSLGGGDQRFQRGSSDVEAEKEWYWHRLVVYARQGGAGFRPLGAQLAVVNTI